ncbi:MAG: cell envelope integrity protein CreD [Opitutaceae bacterium]|nr:cell envelope integrity protein CreD [Opitutaceae bacterium]
MSSAPPPVIPTPASRRLTVFLKLSGICLLIVLLHGPLALTHGVLRERLGYQAQATEEIAARWGRRQLVTGPVLAVPYAYQARVIRSKVVGGRVAQVEETELTPAIAYFLPERLAVSGTVAPEVRHRGIYDTVVYSTKLKLAGEFVPDFVAADIVADRIDWEKARVLLGVSDLHGLRSVGPVSLAGRAEAPFEPADAKAEDFLPLAAAVAGVTAGAKLEFAFDVGLQGSERLEIAPLGKATTAALESAWADPSFTGAALPVSRQVGPGGFQAAWEASHFSRGFPQSWTNRFTKSADMAARMEGAAFGVRFAQLADGYSMVERAQKYGVLFFVLSFAVFFLFEVTAGLRIHALQYALVGAALCLFFLGFLALSEFWPTGRAYGVAAAACTALVSFYAWNFLRTGRRTLVIGGGLGATYGYLYFVLQSQDYALVAGTAALFLALALVMYCTRRINWYAVEVNSPVSAP